jgi:cytoskeletal protein CcmA (bactofilin family)
MGLFQKEDKAVRPDETGPLVSQPAAMPPPVSPTTTSTQREFQAHLGQGSRIEGRLSFDASVRIDGQVEGEIAAKETVLIGESAVVSAQIQGSTVIILGRVNGDVTARKRVELRAPGRLIGNLNTPALVIHEGVTFEGHCTMAASESRAEKGDKKVAIFPTEERAQKDDRSVVAKVSSEAAK